MDELFVCCIYIYNDCYDSDYNYTCGRVREERKDTELIRRRRYIDSLLVLLLLC